MPCWSKIPCAPAAIQKHLQAHRRALGLEKSIEDINKDELSCKSCGVKLDCLCPKCREEKDTNDYFEKLYNDIMFENQE